ncbi:MAG: hypothetical protein AB1757_12385 [Acidobacteriota bacterium]
MDGVTDADHCRIALEDTAFIVKSPVLATARGVATTTPPARLFPH